MKFEKAKELLRKGWCKGTMFRDAQGRQCREPEAVSYCLLGALSAAGITVDSRYYRLLSAETVCDGFAGFNDRQESIEPVLDMVDRMASL